MRVGKSKRGILGDGDALLMADRDYIYARFLVEGEPAAIQASSRTLAVMLDIDADPATGRQRTVDDLPMGVDIEIAYSPREDDGSAGRGVEVGELLPLRILVL